MGDEGRVAGYFEVQLTPGGLSAYLKLVRSFIWCLTLCLLLFSIAEINELRVMVIS